MTMVNSFAIFCNGYIICILAAAIFGKSKNFNTFTENLYDLLPTLKNHTKLIAYLILAIETLLLLGLLLLPTLNHLLMLIITIMFTLMTLFLFYHYQSGKQLKCSCFGATEHFIDELDFLRNFLFIGASASAFVGTPVFLIAVEVKTLFLISALPFSILSIHLHELRMVLTSSGAR